MDYYNNYNPNVHKKKREKERQVYEWMRQQGELGSENETRSTAEDERNAENAAELLGVNDQGLDVDNFGQYVTALRSRSRVGRNRTEMAEQYDSQRKRKEEKQCEKYCMLGGVVAAEAACLYAGVPVTTEWLVGTACAGATAGKCAADLIEKKKKENRDRGAPRVRDMRRGGTRKKKKKNKRKTRKKRKKRKTKKKKKYKRRKKTRRV